jgi:hypothetical protein
MQSPNRPIRSQLRLDSVGYPYLRHIDNDDTLLSSFSREDRWEVVSCSALRVWRFQPGKRKVMVQSTIKDTLGAVAQIVRFHRHNDPRVNDRLFYNEQRTPRGLIIGEGASSSNA